VDLVRGLFVLPEGFSGGGIDGDELAREVGGVDAVFDEGGGAREADVVVIAPELGVFFEDELLGGIGGGDFKTDEAAF